MTSFLGARPRKGTALLPSFTMAILLLFASPPTSVAHEGHDHGPPAGGGASPPSPRVVATSERYQLVGIVEGQVLVIYLDRATDNAPVTTATMEVAIDGDTGKAVVQKFRAAGFEPAGYTMYTYIGVQAAAAAIKNAKTTSGAGMAKWLKANPVDTVLGKKAWDANGDLTVADYVVYEYKADGTYAKVAK